jgi:hypothetical protein
MKITIRRKANGRTSVRLMIGSLLSVTLEFPSGRKP